MNPQQNLCPVCHNPVIDSYYFCPNCGKNLKPAPLPTTLIKQIGIYAISIFLPPFGLWPAIKYLRQEGRTAKTIGIVAIILTAISVILSTWLLSSWVNQINQSINTQLYRYQGLGL